MADEEHLKILKQGVKVWNRWREDNYKIQVDLSDTDLSGANLKGMELIQADLSGTDLSGAELNVAILIIADLSRANLSGAILHHAELGGSSLAEADLSRADLSLARLVVTHLSHTDLNEAIADNTVFANLDLRGIKGLETIRHRQPSTIGIDTLQRSQGMIPEVFLRGCGLSDWEIEAAKLYRPDLSNEEINVILDNVHDLRAHQAVQISPLFISYSHSDGAFVDHMEHYLNDKGIRFWRDVHHATAGRLEKQVDRAIRHNPIVLLILSANSVKSDWVEHEVRLARRLEIETERDVLCPVALDDSWKTCRWPERLREQIEEYNVLDFSNWKDETFFQRMFTRLIDGLDLFYKEKV